MNYAQSTCLLLYFLVPFIKPLVSNFCNIALDNDKDSLSSTEVASILWESLGADYCFKELKFVMVFETLFRRMVKPTLKIRFPSH